MQFTNRSATIQWFLTIAGLSGIASIFLSFTFDISPFTALDYDSSSFLFGVGDFSPESSNELWVLGAPFLLSVVISASLIRWNLTGRLSLLEQTIIYLIGLSLMAIVIMTNFIAMADVVMDFDMTSFTFKEMMAFIFSAGFLIAGIFLVIRNHRLGKFKNLSPIMLMQTAYLGNAMFCLIGFWGNWQIGAYFTLATVIVYAAQMVWLSCQKKTILAVKPQES